MENSKLVSIIVPVYNNGNRIEKSIAAFVNQTYERIEIILVDDGSTDNSLSVCHEYKEKDSRIQVFHTENRGSGPARNYGISVAKGSYLYFPDSDDYIEPETIQTLIQYAEKTDADIVFCGYKDVSEDGRVINEKKYIYAEVSGEQIRNNYAYYKILAPQFGIRGAPWNKLFKKRIVDSYHIEYPALKRHQDEAFIARFISYCEKAVFIPEVLYTYYLNDQSAEWRKYPTTYIDAVNGLFNDRKQNVLKWNTKDVDTREMIFNEFICNTIKAYELSFSPKFNFDRKLRLEWIKKQVDTSEILSINITKTLGIYQKIVLTLIKSKHFRILYKILQFKVFMFGKVIKRHSR